MHINFVTNRSGQLEPINFSKIRDRLSDLCLNAYYGKTLGGVCVNTVTLETMYSIYDKIKTTELDDQSCRIALGKYFVHGDYEKLAARVSISSLLKTVSSKIEDYVQNLDGVLSAEYAQLLLNNKLFFTNLQNPRNNYRYSFRGFYVLKRSHYLLRKLGTEEVAETPDMATIRVATALAVGKKTTLTEEDQILIKKYYDIFSAMRISMATPVLLNAGTTNSQFASCFVMKVGDSLESIMKHTKISAICQKYSGGIGTSWSALRSRGSVIKGTNGVAGGLVPLAKVIDKLGYYIDQGGGKRPGSISPYISIWHPDLLDTLDLRKVKNSEVANEAHRLYYAVWITNNFLEAVKKGDLWYFIDPRDSAELEEVHGEEFNKLYEKLSAGAVKTMPARLVMQKILEVQANSGMPYIVNKDNVNIMRNQPATIYSSNLCSEITIPANEKEVGVCNLGSISIKKFLWRSAEGEYENPINGRRYTLDENLLENDVKTLVRMINGAIDSTFYPTPECRYSNELRRPMGIGVMGVADALCKIGLPFGSEAACEFRARFEELITYFAYEESMLMAIESGPIQDHHLYKSGQGILHPQLFKSMWPVKFPFRKDWEKLAQLVKINGLKNSVLRANMPTGNTGIIMGNSLCFEPYESNIYKLSAYAIELVVINKYLRRDLQHLGVLNDKLINRLLNVGGSIQNLVLKFFRPDKQEIPNEDYVKKVYRAAAFEISPFEVMDMCIAAQPFIDQSQSMNLWHERISINTANLYIYGAERGLKTLCYYIKSSAATKKNVCENCSI